MLVAFSITLNPLIAKVNAFFLIQTSLAVSTGGATFYFFTDTPEQYPEGPHFSLEFFISVLGLISSACSLLGISMYSRYMQGWTYRRLLWLTNSCAFGLSIFDVVVFTRLNISLGIPDKAFVLGTSVCQTII